MPGWTCTGLPLMSQLSKGYTYHLTCPWGSGFCWHLLYRLHAAGFSFYALLPVKDSWQGHCQQWVLLGKQAARGGYPGDGRAHERNPKP